jgi:uncharacterized protein (TIGR02145 family)
LSSTIEFEMKKIHGFWLSALLLIAGGCEKKEVTPVKRNIEGLVQKGPFVAGTTITMFELNSRLDQTGKTFAAQIGDNSGLFEVKNVAVSSTFVEFSASGYYFDEVKGDLSVGPLNLYAVADINDVLNVNVNILTHLEKLRIKSLVSDSNPFSQAKKTAQHEILAAFGFSNNDVANSEALDISKDTEDNAILLAVSILLQGNRSVGSLTELLATISNDLRDDGKLSDERILKDLRNSAMELDLSAIRSNLVKRYRELGVNATIPNFEKYIGVFLEFTSEKPMVPLATYANVTTNSVTLNGTVNPNSASTTVVFEYGTSIDYGSTATSVESPITGFTPVSVSANLAGLMPGLTYHFRIKVENTNGIAYSSDQTFTTIGKVPTITSSTYSDLTAKSAKLAGVVNPNSLVTAVTFEYGTSASYGSTATLGNSLSGSVAVNVGAALTDLVAGTTYHFRIKCENLLGATYSNDQSFKTFGAVPTAVTVDATTVTSSSAKLNASVNSNWLETAITFEWGTTSGYGNAISAVPSPLNSTYSLNVSAQLSGLSANTTYHYRVVAVNELGTTAGGDMTFATPPEVMDIEGKIYKTIKIGTQVWMAENLGTTKYNDGTDITLGTSDQNMWRNLITPAYNWYNADISLKDTYGALYNWYAINTNKLCPSDWHVPTDSEWTTLESFLGGPDVAGGKLKEAGTSHWTAPNTGATNSVGFTALPGGNFGGLGTVRLDGWWWTSSQGLGADEAINRYIFQNAAKVWRVDYEKKFVGNSVRCVKN